MAKKDKRFRVLLTESPSLLVTATILVDTVTGVHYLSVGSEGIGLTPLLDEQGKVVINRDAFAAQGLALISLASPTTPPERLAALCAQAQGYLYYVTYAGVTGAAQLDVGEAAGHLAQVRALASVPVFAGFGIRDADSAARMAAHADGVVVGSALVEAMTAAGDPAAAATCAAGFLRPLRHALDARATAPA